MSSQAQEIHDLVYQVLRHLQSNDRDKCACYDVTPLQSLVLLEVAQKQPLGMQQLAQRMQLAVSTMTRVVDKLVKGGLIFRQEDRNDRRVVLCSLTKEGQKVAQQLENCYKDFFNKLATNIPPRDLDGFLVGLRVMVRQLQGCSTECGCGVKKN